MKTGFRIELSGDELSTVITACGVRLRELSELLEMRIADAPEAYAGKMYLEKQYRELSAVLRILENADYFVEMGA